MLPRRPWSPNLDEILDAVQLISSFRLKQVSVNMPSVEVGTVGGGTSLPAQSACLDIVGCRGATKEPGRPGDNAQQMAR